MFSSVNEAEEIRKFIIDFSIKEKLKYVEFRSSETKFPFDTQEYRTDLRHLLNLDTTEKEILKSFSENTKRNIKKAAKENVEVLLCNDVKGINDFYEMFCVTRQKHGLPPQPYSFFKNIYNLIIKTGLGDIVLAKQKEKFIAGAVYFKIGKKILYKYGASYHEFNDLRGNNAVMWFAIQKYLNEKFIEFDFGRTEIAHEGLRRFKLGWNAEERFIYTTRFDLNQNKYLPADIKTEGFHNKVFNNAPVWLLKIVGNKLYKHIG